MSQKTRTCTLCKKRRKIKFFEAREQTGGGVTYRGICRDCHVIDRNRKRSSSYKSFLNLLHNQLRHTRVSKFPDKDWEITPEDLIEIWDEQDGLCALSGVLMTHNRAGCGKKDLNVTIDRIDPSVWYVRSNIQLVCQRANIIKHTLTEDMMLWWCENIVRNKKK